MNSLDSFFLGWYKFVSSMEQETFINFFWYFLFIELFRYVIFDFIVVARRKIQRKKYESRKAEARNKLFSEKPLISVIAPGKNEGANIGKLSDSLSEQTYQNFELIVVDDGSDDNSKELCTKLLKEGKIDQFLSNPIRGGKASAANAAMMFVKGKYVVHLDADSYLAKDGLETIIIPFYENEKIGAVGGDIRVNNIENTLATALQGVEYMKTITLGRLVASELNIMRIISGAYGAFRTDVLRKIGGWDVGPGLDGDITVKFRKIGWKVVFEESSVCYTNSPLLFIKLAKQRFRWDRSLVRFRLRKHANVYLPESNFNFATFITLADGVLYNFVFNYLWWIYIFGLLIMAPKNLDYILVTNYFLYMFSNFAQFSIIIWAVGVKSFRKKDWSLILFLPLMPLYSGMFLRLVRTYAQIMELIFKVSYDDPWNPWKVSRVVKEKGL